MKLSAACLLATALAAPAFQAQPRSPRTPQSLLQFSSSIEELARSCNGAVVQISVRGRAPVEESEARHAGFIAKQSGTGSGVIVDSYGYIVTNAHVVADARQIDVSVIERGQSGEELKHHHYPGTIVGVDRDTDLAVVKIEATGLPTLPFREDADGVKQGELVVALGSPMGLDNSLTVGFVSAPVRHLSPDKPSFYIQTDTPINPGNSGGPLLDAEGRVVGINTMILTQSGGSEGIGFAIPSAVVRQTYLSLRKNKTIQRGAIGVIPEDITPTLATALGLKRDSGVILSDIVPQGAAEAAGLQPGDIVVAADGHPLEHSRQLMAAVFQHVVGEQITLDIQRGADRLTKVVAIMERPKSPQDLAQLASRDADLVRSLGIFALTLDEKVTPLLPNLRRLSGVVVAGIPAEFEGFNPGLIAGDVIYEVNGARVETVDALRAVLSDKKPGAAMALLVERLGQLIYVPFDLE